MRFQSVIRPINTDGLSGHKYTIDQNVKAAPRRPSCSEEPLQALACVKSKVPSKDVSQVLRCPTVFEVTLNSEMLYDV